MWTINQECDEIAYRVAFACQKQGYTLERINCPKGKVYDFKDKYTKTEIKTKMLEKGYELDKDYIVTPYAILEPEATVIHTLDVAVSKLFDLVYKDRKVQDVNLWLSSKSNFRYAIAETGGSKGIGYKAGRPEKPYYLPLIRERLIEEWGAVEIEGFEADDALGIYRNADTIASHIDKDINMIPGVHYNHVTGEFYEVEDGLGQLVLDDKKRLKGYGLIFFYAQLLMGDSTDNIPGIPKIGPVGAVKLLGECVTESEAINIVVEQYSKRYGSFECGKVLAEIADLLWICQDKNETGRQYLQNRGFL